MWYVAHKYTRLLRKDKEETKKDVPVKGRKNKNKSAKNTITEDQVNTPDKKAVITNGEETGRRRSSRVAKAEISKEANKDSEDSPKPRKKIKLEKSDENSETKKAEPVKNGCHSDGEVAGDTQDKPWVPVYLTKSEISGLECLIERLRDWPHAQKCIPSSITNPKELLSELEVRSCFLADPFISEF